MLTTVNLQQALIDANPGLTLSTDLSWTFVGYRTTSVQSFQNGTFSVDGEVPRLYEVDEQVGINAAPIVWVANTSTVCQFVFRAFVGDAIGFDNDMLVTIDVDQVWRDGLGSAWVDGSNQEWVWAEFQ